MSATFQWSGEYGSSVSPTILDLGLSGNLFNFKDSDSLASPADYTSYPITAGNNSYEIWLRGHFTGTFNKIQTAKFWKSSGDLGTGISILWDGTTVAYVTPIKTTSSIATDAIPTSSPSSANVSFGGDLDGNITAAGYTDYIIMQMQTTVATSAGDTNIYTYTMTYQEN